MGLREAILEANESERDKEQDWRTIAKRSSSWFLFVLSLIGSAYCVVLVVDRYGHSCVTLKYNDPQIQPTGGR